MVLPNFSHENAVQAIIMAIQARAHATEHPFIVGIDGGSGAGKSTLTLAIAEILKAIIIPSDDFYAAHIPNLDWERWTPIDRYKMVLDWERLRTEALEPLLHKQSAHWHTFDFNQQQLDGTYPLRTDWVERSPSDVIVLEGAYATRPELADLLDFTVLVDVPADVRRQRLALREEEDWLVGWHRRWDAVEEYYFSQVRPTLTFDLVVKN